MMSVETERKHDPMVCGIDPGTDCDECRPATERLRRMEALQERLEKAGISLGDLAALIYDFLEDHFEEQVERIAVAKVRAVLRKVKLRSVVDWTSVDWRKETV